MKKRFSMYGMHIEDPCAQEPTICGATPHAGLRRPEPMTRRLLEEMSAEELIARWGEVERYLEGRG